MSGPYSFNSYQTGTTGSFPPPQRPAQSPFQPQTYAQFPSTTQAFTPSYSAPSNPPAFQPASFGTTTGSQTWNRQPAFNSGAATPPTNPSSFASSNMHSSTYPAYGASYTQTGTRGVKYSTTIDRSSSSDVVTMSAITGMPQYANKSFEELRLEDYKNKPAGGFNTGYSATPSFSAPAQTPAYNPPFGTSSTRPGTTGYGNYTPRQTSNSPFTASTTVAPAFSSSFQTASSLPASSFPPQSFSSSFSTSSFPPSSYSAAPAFNPTPSYGSSPFGTSSIGGQLPFSSSPAFPSSSFPQPFSAAQSSVFQPTTTQPFFTQPHSTQSYSAAQPFQVSTPFTAPPPFSASQPYSASQPFAPTPRSSFFMTSNPTSFSTSQPSSFFVSQSNPQTSYYPQPQAQYAPPQSYSQLRPQYPQQPYSTQADYYSMQNLQAAYRDPHGLSWLFPGGVPEDILSAARNRHGSLPTNESASVIERAIRQNRASVSPPPAPSSGSSSKPKPVDLMFERRHSPHKTDPAVFSRRENFRNLQFEPYTSAEDTLFAVKSSPASKIPDDCVEVSVEAITDKPVNVKLVLQKRMRVSDVILKATSAIPGLPENLRLSRKRIVLPEYKTLEEIGVTSGDRLEVIVFEIDNSPLALPKLIRPGYSMKPTLSDLSQMTAAQLSRVPNFTIANEHGSIVFEGETDVRGLDLDQAVQIQPSAVVVYPDDSSLEKPAPGCGLNKPALITLLNCKPKKQGQEDKFEAKLRKYCAANDCELTLYDPAKGIWQFKVQHF